jgi:DNA-binding winged helix-turn-helix (wHTH) protein
MRYSIDNKVILTDCGVTTPGTESTELNISTVPLRLLTFFVENSNRLITREEIYKHVWEIHNLAPSGTALATQISYIRKVLSAYALSDDIIITKPKQGFIFNAVIASVDTPQKTMNISQKKRIKSQQKNLYDFLFLCLLLTATTYYLFSQVNQNHSIKWMPLSITKSCHVFMISTDVSQTVSQYYQKKVNEFLTKNGLHCDESDMVIVHIQHPDTYGRNSVYETKQFYAYCKKMKEGYTCDNTYYSAGKID